MRNYITHITKLEFLPCFKQAYNAAITPSNIQGGFQGAGLVPFALDQVISCLDVKLRTLSPLLPNNDPWQLQTLSNTLELGSQLTLVNVTSCTCQRHVAETRLHRTGADPTMTLLYILHYTAILSLRILCLPFGLVEDSYVVLAQRARCPLVTKRNTYIKYYISYYLSSSQKLAF